jgi:hypothetical protein
MGRRAFCVGAAGTLAIGATAGGVSAMNSAIAWDSDLAPDPRIPNSTVTIDTVESSMSALDFTNNDGETENLSGYGVQIEPPTEADSNDDIEFQPHNPVTIRADLIDSDQFTAFPRDATREDSDGDTVDVSGLDAAEWSGSMSVSDDGDALSLSAAAAGESATLDLTALDSRIDSGAERRVIFTVASVSSLGGSAVEIAVEGGSGNSVTETLADATGNGIVTQSKIGELSGASNLDGISSVTITAVGGGADLTLHGLDLERQSTVALGTQESITQDDDGNDQIETQDVEEPSGSVSITSLSSIAIGYNAIESVEFAVEFVASELPPEQVSVEFVDAPSARSVDRAMNLAVEFAIPSAFDLSWSLGSLTDTGFVQSSQLIAVEAADDVEIADLDDPLDMPDSATDETSNYALGEDVTISSVTPSPGVSTTISYETLLTTDQEASLSDSGGFFAAGGGGGGGGGLSGSLRGMVFAIAGIGATIIAWLRARGASLTG